MATKGDSQVDYNHGIYSPLDPKAREIRILVVSGSFGSERVSCELDIASLNDDPHYTALSYVWGESDSQVEITVCGRPFKVTRNCYIALKNLRNCFRSLRLWVDAICINQEDMVEKQHQVQMMGLIYNKAFRTWLWLGERSGNSDLGMKLVRSISYKDFSPTKLEHDAKSWEALFHLLRRSWWTRLWAVPEALQSIQPIVRCGLTETPLHRFVDLHRLVEMHQNINGLLPFHAGAVFETMPFRPLFFSWSLIKPNGLLQPLRIFSWMQWTYLMSNKHAKDRIFASMSLSLPKDQEAIKIDYERPDRDLFLEFAAYFVQERALLVLSSGRVDKTYNFGLPSWVPDRSTQGLLIDSSVVMNTQAELTGPSSKHVRADGRSTDWEALGFPRWNLDPNNAHPTAHISADMETLATRGLLIDYVSFTDASFLQEQLTTMEKDQMEGRPLLSAFVREHGIHTVQHWERVLFDFPNSIYDPGCGRNEAFWRTLIGDRTVTIQPPPGDYSARFDSWMGRNVSHTGIEREQFEKPCVQCAFTKCKKKAFAITNLGYIGLLPADTQQGDLVCIFHGGRVPYILRPRENETHRYIGEAYVHGIMYGEGVRSARAGEVREFWIT